MNREVFTFMLESGGGVVCEGRLFKKTHEVLSRENSQPSKRLVQYGWCLESGGLPTEPCK